MPRFGVGLRDLHIGPDGTRRLLDGARPTLKLIEVRALFEFLELGLHQLLVLDAYVIGLRASLVLKNASSTAISSGV